MRNTERIPSAATQPSPQLWSCSWHEITPTLSNTGKYWCDSQRCEDVTASAREETHPRSPSARPLLAQREAALPEEKVFFSIAPHEVYRRYLQLSFIGDF